MLSAKLWFNMTLASTLLLILTYLIDTLYLRFSPVSALMYLLPLCFFLYALIRRNYRLLQWLGFVLMVYFLDSVLTLFAPDRLIIGGITMALCFTIFTSVVFFIHKNKPTIKNTAKENPL